MGDNGAYEEMVKMGYWRHDCRFMLLDKVTNKDVRGSLTATTVVGTAITDTNTLILQKF